MLSDNDLKALVELRLESDGDTCSIYDIVQDIRREVRLDIRSSVNTALYGLSLVNTDKNSSLATTAGKLAQRWKDRHFA